MRGMNRNSRTIALIERSLHRLETDDSSTSLDALGLLDEVRRLRRKWDEQVAAGSPRRIESDFREMNGWLRRWSIAARRILITEPLPQLREAAETVAAELER